MTEENTARSPLRYRISKRKSRRRPESVEKIVQGAFRKYGLADKLAKYTFVLHWKEIVGAGLASKSYPEKIRNGVLAVKVSSSAWAQEMTFQKDIILNRLQGYLSESQQVRDIKFYV